jgi:hypothetical protein
VHVLRLEGDGVETTELDPSIRQEGNLTGPSCFCSLWHLGGLPPTQTLTNEPMTTRTPYDETRAILSYPGKGRNVGAQTIQTLSPTRFSCVE